MVKGEDKIANQYALLMEILMLLYYPTRIVLLQFEGYSTSGEK